MNEEMFMKLIEMVGNAGEGGFMLAITYMVWPHVVTLLIWVIIATTLYKGLTMIMMAVAATDSDDLLLRELIVMTTGITPGHYISLRDRDRLRTHVQELKEKAK